MKLYIKSKMMKILEIKNRGMSYPESRQKSILERTHKAVTIKKLYNQISSKGNIKNLF